MNCFGRLAACLIAAMCVCAAMATVAVAQQSASPPASATSPWFQWATNSSTTNRNVKLDQTTAMAAATDVKVEALKKALADLQKVQRQMDKDHVKVGSALRRLTAIEQWKTTLSQEIKTQVEQLIQKLVGDTTKLATTSEMQAYVDAAKQGLEQNIAALTDRVTAVETTLNGDSSGAIGIVSRLDTVETGVRSISARSGATLFVSATGVVSSSNDSMEAVGGLVNAQVCVPTSSGWFICGEGGLGGNSEATLWQAGLSVPYLWEYMEFAPLVRVLVADPSAEVGIGTFTSVLGARVGAHFSVFEFGVEGGAGLLNDGVEPRMGWLADVFVGVRLF